MQTLLSRFCEEFVQVVRPLMVPLDRSVEAISAGTNGVPGKEIQTSLVDLRHQVEVLVDKVAEQQAYVMIFGPLKSGKSTMMNALAGSYVSEVTSLPAYPCMLFVSGGSRQEFTVTDYRGKAETFTDAAQFRSHVDRAHTQLAARIRETESRREQFDPQVHFPEAIRRIDARVPGGDLARSAAVFVDTPGLYSRMRFGYDRMTREFRDAAACAVFVVRSDNLYLEQVFDEFNKLLELFSKIFLVVNLDTDKKDLRPDGTLVPSLEQKDPGRLIEAFETLTMSAPLKKAAEEGRLRIYPVGLLHAASRVLRGAAPQKAAGEGEYERFRKDLTEYLDSPDYLLSFLGDSLRRARTLLDEAVQLCRHRDLETLQGRLQSLEFEEKNSLGQLNGITELESFAWDRAFSELHAAVAPALDQLAADIGEGIGAEMESRLRTWFSSSASLESLVKGDLLDLFTRFQVELTQAVSKELSDRVVAGDAGIEVPAEVTAALSRIGIDLGRIGTEMHNRADRGALVAVPPTPLRSEHVPVRRGLGDWLCFRSAPAIRRRLLGPPEAPARPIPKDLKASRLGDAAMTAVRHRLTTYKRGFFADTTARIRTDFLGAYCRATRGAVDRLLGEKKQALREQLESLQADQEAIREMLEPLAELRRKGERALQAVGKLSQHYGQVDMFLLTKPVEIPAVKPAPPVGGRPGSSRTPAPGSPPLAGPERGGAGQAPPPGPGRV